jgi:hypothetical protein
MSRSRSKKNVVHKKVADFSWPGLTFSGLIAELRKTINVRQKGSVLPRGCENIA